MMIIEPFNSVFWVLIAAMLLLGTLLCLRLRKKEPEVRRRTIIELWGILWVLFITYRLLQSADGRYLQHYGLAAYNWWDALPLQLCYCSLFLTPLALWKNWKYLLAFCFYITPLGALMALCFPDPLFVGQSLSDPHVLLFYVLHGLLVIVGFMTAPLGLFRPSFKALLPTIGILFVLTGLVHGVNVILRATTFPLANYFYTFDTAGISVFDLCWGVLPVPFLYELLLAPIAAVYITLVNGVYLLIQKLRKPKQA